MKQYLTASLSDGILDVDILRDKKELESAIRTNCNNFLRVINSEELKDFLERENFLDDVEITINDDYGSFYLYISDDYVRLDYDIFEEGEASCIDTK
jgi:hypothetical protein